MKLYHGNAGNTMSDAELLQHNIEITKAHTSLQREHHKLKFDHNNVSKLRETANTDIQGFMDTQQRMADLEWKITTLKDERSEFYKTQSQNAQKLLDLTNELRKREEQWRTLQAEHKHSLAEFTKAQKTLEDYVHLVKEKDGIIQILQDEMTALQLELVTKEEKLKKVEFENSQLVERWLRKMNEEAEHMNQANHQAEAVRKQYAESVSTEQLSECLDDEHYFGFARKLSDANRALTRLPTHVFRELENIHGGEVHTLHISHDGALLATGGQDKRVKIFDSKTGSLRYTLNGCLQSVLHVRFNPTDEMILATSSDNAVRVWSLATGRIVHTLTGHIGKVVAAEFDGESRKIVSVSHDRTIKVWDLLRGYCTKTIFSISSCNDLVLTDPQAATIVTGHIDSVIRLWNMTTGHCIREVIGVHDAPVTSLTLSPDASVLLSNSRDSTLKLLDTTTFEVTQVFSAEGYRPGSNWSRASFSPDGRYVAAGSADGTIYIWYSQTGELRSKVKEHTTPICAVYWDATGQLFYSAEKDQLVCFWE
ncbi:hypothetical protein IWQ61_005214 [Dispira simplex]|nr:hypothetical protein IWQ61_005214 [Dispira simplex]